MTDELRLHRGFFSTLLSRVGVNAPPWLLENEGSDVLEYLDEVGMDEMRILWQQALVGLEQRSEDPPADLLSRTGCYFRYDLTEAQGKEWCGCASQGVRCRWYGQPSAKERGGHDRR